MIEKRKLPENVDSQRDRVFVLVEERMRLQRQQSRTLLGVFGVAATVGLLAASIIFALGINHQNPQVTVKTLEPSGSAIRSSGKPRKVLVSFEYISDDELLALLEDLGDPSVMGTIGDQVIVVRQ